MSEKQFDVIGMTCAACQANVEKAVAKLPGVQSVDVSLLNNSMKVDFDPDQTNPDAIEQAVSNIGYEAVLKGQHLNESQGSSIQAEWEARQKRNEEEQKKRKTALYGSLILLAVLLCFSMLPMMGVFTFLMDMEWGMVNVCVQVVLTLFILFLQRDFFTHGLKALFKGAPNMDSLVAVGGGAAFLYGLYGMLSMAWGYGTMNHEVIHAGMHSLYFESAAMIVTLVSLGKYMEARSKTRTSDALGKLVDLAPKSAVIEKDGVEIQVATDQITSGDIVVIRPGQRIPVDGVVLSGTGYVDQSAITGESVPVDKTEGDPVISATMNVNGSFRFEATKVGEDTTLSQIIRLVDEAGSSKAPIARLADKVSGIFVPVVIGIAAVTFIVWMLVKGDFAFALSNAISVLVISCPCALGLATPVAIMVSTGKAAEYGILIKSAEALENLHAVNTVVLDKTGTITSGKPGVQSIAVFDKQYSPDEFLSVAASLESGSEHPLGKAVVEEARARNLPVNTAASFEAVGGKGLRARLDAVSYSAGNLRFMQEEGVQLSDTEKKRLDAMAARGQTPLLFARAGQLIGMIGVADQIRPTSAEALKLLHKQGIQVVMLTGDNKATASAIASGLAIDDVISDVLPADKESVIRSLQEKGRNVAMVGDGINDAPALTRANIGIAIGAGTDIAIESADVVLMKDNLLDVVTAIELSRATIRNIKENLFWAFFYNILGIPVAAGVFYPFFGWLLNPMLGAAAMSLSSVCVVTNALRLRFFKPQETKAEIATQQETGHEVKVFEEYETRIENEAEALPAPVTPVSPEEQPKEEKTTMETTIKVNGMSCQHCAKRVEDAISKVDGVTLATVSLPEGKAMIESSKPLDQDKLFQAVIDAGYEPEKL